MFKLVDYQSLDSFDPIYPKARENLELIKKEGLIDYFDEYISDNLHDGATFVQVVEILLYADEHIKALKDNEEED